MSDQKTESGRILLIFYTFAGNTLVYDVVELRPSKDESRMVVDVKGELTGSPQTVNFPKERCTLLFNAQPDVSLQTYAEYYR